MIRANNWQQDLMQILWLHDEFVFRARKSMLDLIVPEVIRCMEFDVKGWPVKLKAEIEVGHTEISNWGEMVSWKEYKTNKIDTTLTEPEEETEEILSRRELGY